MGLYRDHKEQLRSSDVETDKMDEMDDRESQLEIMARGNNNINEESVTSSADIDKSPVSTLTTITSIENENINEKKRFLDNREEIDEKNQKQTKQTKNEDEDEDENENENEDKTNKRMKLETPHRTNDVNNSVDIDENISEKDTIKQLINNDKEEVKILNDEVSRDMKEDEPEPEPEPAHEHEHEHDNEVKHENEFEHEPEHEAEHEPEHDNEVEDEEDEEEELEDVINLKKSQHDESEEQDKENSRVDAMNRLKDIEISFAQLKDKLYETQLNKLEFELKLCESNKHPELLDYMKMVDDDFAKKAERLLNLQKYKLKCLDNQTRAQRVALHQQFMKSCQDLKRKEVVQITTDWYDINKERRTMDMQTLNLPEYFQYNKSINSSNIEQFMPSLVHQRNSVYKELSVLQGLVNYKNMIPSSLNNLKGCSDEEINTDLQEMGLL